MDFIPWADASFRRLAIRLSGKFPVKEEKGRTYEHTESYCDYFGRERALGKK